MDEVKRRGEKRITSRRIKDANGAQLIELRNQVMDAQESGKEGDWPDWCRSQNAFWKRLGELRKEIENEMLLRYHHAMDYPFTVNGIRHDPPIIEPETP